MPRTPVELSAFVESIRLRAQRDSKERELGHLKKGCYKQFFDEVVPLARFAHRMYPPEYTVTPKLGNQGYDAEIHDPRGNLVERVEMANPIDGKETASIARELVKQGYGGFRAGDPGDDVEEHISIIAQVAKKKAIKDYSDATVVFKVNGSKPFEGFEKRFSEQLVAISAAISSAGLNAKRVFLLLPIGCIPEVMQVL